MIQLTKLGGNRFVLNAEMIRTVESRPDTYITLMNGEQYIVLESVMDVVSRSLGWSASVRRSAVTN